MPPAQITHAYHYPTSVLLKLYNNFIKLKILFVILQRIIKIILFLNVGISYLKT
jgi:hypothetical protein